MLQWRYASTEHSTKIMTTSIDNRSEANLTEILKMFDQKLIHQPGWPTYVPIDNYTDW